MCGYVCMDVYESNYDAYIHAYMHTCIHAYIHTYTHTSVLELESVEMYGGLNACFAFDGSDIKATRCR